MDIVKTNKKVVEKMKQLYEVLIFGLVLVNERNNDEDTFIFG